MSRRTGNETVIVDLRSGETSALNEVGARVWQLLSEGKTIAQVCDVVSREYEAGLPQIQDDVLELVEELLAHNLIEISPGSEA